MPTSQPLPGRARCSVLGARCRVPGAGCRVLRQEAARGRAAGAAHGGEAAAAAAAARASRGRLLRARLEAGVSEAQPSHLLRKRLIGRGLCGERPGADAGAAPGQSPQLQGRRDGRGAAPRLTDVRGAGSGLQRACSKDENSLGPAGQPGLRCGEGPGHRHHLRSQGAAPPSTAELPESA